MFIFVRQKWTKSLCIDEKTEQLRVYPTSVGADMRTEPLDIRAYFLIAPSFVSLLPQLISARLCFLVPLLSTSLFHILGVSLVNSIKPDFKIQSDTPSLNLGA